jgi:methylated-DNA-protein-cysteine methyltransferase-like protein
MKSFSQRVIECAKAIPKGRVTTYGRIAKAAGAGPMASQSITGILWKAWQGDKQNIPYHRIVYANGRVWIDAKHRKERLAIYKKEKIEIIKGRVKNFRDLLFEF